MSADRVQKDLICRLLAELVALAPKRAHEIMHRFGFRHGDVMFTTTDKGNWWTEVFKWPWEGKETP